MKTQMHATCRGAIAVAILSFLLRSSAGAGELVLASLGGDGDFKVGALALAFEEEQFAGAGNFLLRDGQQVATRFAEGILYDVRGVRVVELDGLSEVIVDRDVQRDVMTSALVMESGFVLIILVSPGGTETLLGQLSRIDFEAAESTGGGLLLATCGIEATATDNDGVSHIASPAFLSVDGTTNGFLAIEDVAERTTFIDYVDSRVNGGFENAVYLNAAFLNANYLNAGYLAEFLGVDADGDAAVVQMTSRPVASGDGEFYEHRVGVLTIQTDPEAAVGRRSFYTDETGVIRFEPDSN